MNIHEYQSKQILRQYGLHVPEGYPAFTVEDAVQSAKRLDTPVVVVKAQIRSMQADAAKQAASRSLILLMKSVSMQEKSWARHS